MSKQGRVYLPFPIDDILTFKTGWDQFTENPSVYKIKTRKWKALSNLISNLQFLNYNWSDVNHPEIQIVYVGYPSQHLYLLTQIFKWAKYHFYFNTRSIKTSEIEDSRLENIENVTIHFEDFEEDLEKWNVSADVEKNVYLILNCFVEDESDSNKAMLLREQDKWISKIFPTKCLTRISLPLVFPQDPSKTEDDTHFSFYDGIALRPAFLSETDMSFDLIVTDNVERRIWNVQTMNEAITQHNLIIRQQGFILDFGMGNLGTASFYDENIGITKNFDGNLLYIVIYDYLIKFLQIQEKKPNLSEVFNTIEKILNHISASGKNLLKPKLKV